MFSASGFPTLDVLNARTRDLARTARGLVRLTPLGRSAAGVPIEMISVGDGPRSALIVGLPHPNEPVGCLTIDYLLDVLLRSPRLRRDTGFTWHFIRAIEPDGLRYNEGWLQPPLTPDRYFRHFYRPAFARQAEYAFPLEAPHLRVDRPTPENLAWRRALDLTRPQLQSSLHNADVGGAFYLMSRAIPGLAAQLSRQPAEAGLTLNPYGEPFSEWPDLAPGVFAFPDLAAQAERAAGAGLDPAKVWTAGDSSAAYAQRRYGTFSITNEVPLWDDARLRDTRPSGLRLRDVIGRVHGWNSQCLAFLERRRAIFEAPAQNLREGAFKAALAESYAVAARQEGQFGALAAGDAVGMPLTIAQAALHLDFFRMALMRPFALAAHFGRVAGRRDPEAEANVADSLQSLRREADLRPAPVRSLVGLQVRAIFTAAEAVKRAG